MADHRSSDTRIPDWAIVPFWVGVLALIAGAFADTVAICVYYASLS